jgi:hypothetical protein
MNKKMDFTKNGDPIIKINDQLVSFDKSYLSENKIPLVKSIELESAQQSNEYKVLVLDLSKQSDKEILEQLLEDIANGWWTNIIYLDCKYNSVESKWQVLLIINRSFAKIDGTDTTSAEYLPPIVASTETD